MANSIIDNFEYSLRSGTRIVVVSGLHLTVESELTRRGDLAEFIRVLHSIRGSSLLVFAGNTFDLLSNPDIDIDQLVASNQFLFEELRAFLNEKDHKAFMLLGNRELRLAWDDPMRESLAEKLGVELGLALDVDYEQEEETKKIHIEHGHQFDSTSRYVDQKSRDETPLYFHLSTEIIPALQQGSPVMSGAEKLQPVGALPRFLASRLFYRKIGSKLWLALLPLLVALALKTPLFALFDEVSGVERLSPWTGRIIYVSVALLIDFLLIAAFLFVVARRSWSSIEKAGLGIRLADSNQASISVARTMIADGFHAVITGASSQSEFVPIGPGFYCNVGSFSEVTTEFPAAFGFPTVFLRERHMSWMELELDSDLSAQLFYGTAKSERPSILERVMLRTNAYRDRRLKMVASSLSLNAWPPRIHPSIRIRKIRRIGAAAIAFAGALNLLSALSAPLRSRIHLIDSVVPLAVEQTAAVLTAISGLFLLALSSGIRRGQKLAWRVALVILGASMALHILKGVDFEEAAIAGVVMIYLILNEKAFRASKNLASLGRPLIVLVTGVLLSSLGGVVIIEGYTARRQRFPIGEAFSNSLSRMVGVRLVILPDRLDDFLFPVMVAVSIGLVVICSYMLFKPALSRRLRSDHIDLAAARRVVSRYGRGTLDVFALRDDKQFFTYGDTIVAYSVFNSVCLVAPDPIGPEAERDVAWREFRQFVELHGWILAVFGAGAEWLPIYRASGMFDMYVGDEGIVDTKSFQLGGGKMKYLRQAVNRVANYGYNIEFFDPSELDDSLREGLRSLMRKSRRGGVERGFSMTLGRIFNQQDKGFLLAVAFDKEHKPVAFCQFVPAPGLNGYSLDLMRRDLGDHPNGLIDFLICKSIEHLRENDFDKLGLNFAVLRAVLASGEKSNLAQRLERWLLLQMSDSMQIESLWKFNAKFYPEWLPRYLVFDAPEHLLSVGIAIATAEGLFELPLIGRFIARNLEDSAIAEISSANSSETETG